MIGSREIQDIRGFEILSLKYEQEIVGLQTYLDISMAFAHV